MASGRRRRVSSKRSNARLAHEVARLEARLAATTLPTNNRMTYISRLIGYFKPLAPTAIPIPAHFPADIPTATFKVHIRTNKQARNHMISKGVWGIFGDMVVKGNIKAIKNLFHFDRATIVILIRSIDKPFPEFPQSPYLRAIVKIVEGVEAHSTTSSHVSFGPLPSRLGVIRIIIERELAKESVVGPGSLHVGDGGRWEASSEEDQRRDEAKVDWLANTVTPGMEVAEMGVATMGLEYTSIGRTGADENEIIESYEDEEEEEEEYGNRGNEGEP